MNIINIKNKPKYLEEYIKLCSNEWGSTKTDIELDNYIQRKLTEIEKNDKVISVLALLEDDIIIGFISLFKYDGEERKDLTPWYSTMYVKKEYRSKGYSKILNDEIIKEAKRLGYDRVYLKTELDNYYEKFGAIFIELLNNGEKLYYIDCIH